MREHYCSAALEFTLDGNLIGDIGEAVAAELFSLKLSPRNGAGIDGHAPDGRSVQVKATETNPGPAFRMVETRPDHLLFLVFDLDNLKGDVVYNGPEEPVIKLLPTAWVGQKRCRWQAYGGRMQWSSMSKGYVGLAPTYPKRNFSAVGHTTSAAVWASICPPS